MIASKKTPAIDGLYAKGLCDGSTPPSYEEPIYGNSLESLMAFRNYAESINSDFVVLLIPPSIAAGDNRYFEKLDKVLTSHGIEYLDLAPAIAAASAKGMRPYWTDDPHLNILGNAIAADELGSFLRSR
jgi:hypothetical protein